MSTLQKLWGGGLCPPIQKNEQGGFVWGWGRRKQPSLNDLDMNCNSLVSDNHCRRHSSSNVDKINYLGVAITEDMR